MGINVSAGEFSAINLIKMQCPCEESFILIFPNELRMFKKWSLSDKCDFIPANKASSVILKILNVDSSSIFQLNKQQNSTASALLQGRRSDSVKAQTYHCQTRTFEIKKPREPFHGSALLTCSSWAGLKNEKCAFTHM